MGRFFQVSGWSRLFDQAITVSSVCGLNFRVSPHVSGLAIPTRVHCALHEVSQLRRLFETPTWQTHYRVREMQQSAYTTIRKIDLYTPLRWQLVAYMSASKAEFRAYGS
jgi:hypothetical protein